MGHTVYANQEVAEGSVSVTPVTETFNLKSRAIEIINDSTADDLQYKFKDSADFATLKPSEVMSMDFWTRQVILDSPSSNVVPYRIRAIG